MGSSLLPNMDDVAFYDEHGWFVTDLHCEGSVLDDTSAAVDRFYAGESDFELPPDLAEHDWRPGREGPLRCNDFAYQQIPAVRQLVEAGGVGAVAAALARTSEIRLFGSTLISKYPEPSRGDGRIGWHADLAYWPMCTSTSMLTAWIPLQACAPSSGTLTVLDGSHRWPNTPEVVAARNAESFISDGDISVELAAASVGMAFRPVDLNLKRGQVSFHHCLTFHGSAPNRGNAPRMALAVHLQDGSNRYRRAPDGEGGEHEYKHDRFCRRLPNGDVDYHDEFICPLLWSWTTQVTGKH